MIASMHSHLNDSTIRIMVIQSLLSVRKKGAEVGVSV
jgi:hypothetical protein